MSSITLTLGRKVPGRNRKPAAPNALGTNTETAKWEFASSPVKLVAGEAVTFTLPNKIQYSPFAQEFGNLFVRLWAMSPIADGGVTVAKSVATEFVGATEQPKILVSDDEQNSSRVDAGPGFFGMVLMFRSPPGIGATALTITVPSGLVPAGLDGANVTLGGDIEAASQGVPAGPAPVLVITA